VDECFTWEEWFHALPEQICNDEECPLYFATWIQMALDNDNPKTNKGTNEDEHTDKNIDVDMEDLSDTERREEVEDFGVYNESLFLDDQPEERSTQNLEQNSIDSDLEDEAWMASRDTTFDKEGSSREEISEDEEEEPVAGPSTKVPKFIGMLLQF
jgi:hypothetical protein